jgi:hypothetical protein
MIHFLTDPQFGLTPGGRDTRLNRIVAIKIPPRGWR